MVNDTQIVFQNCPVGPLEGVPGKKNIDKLGAYLNVQTSGVHSNEGSEELGISAQPSRYATQSGSTSFSVPKNLGVTVTYPSGNLTTAVI